MKLEIVTYAYNFSTWRLRQEGHCEFETSLSYILSSKPARVIKWGPDSQIKQPLIQSLQDDGEFLKCNQSFQVFVWTDVNATYNS